MASLLVVIGQRHQHHGAVLALAQQYVDGRVLVSHLHVAVVVERVHLLLADVLVGELAQLQVEEDEAAQQPVVGDEVDLEVTLLIGEALLPVYEGKTAPELQQEVLQVVDDARLQFALGVGRLFLEGQELEDVRVLHRVPRRLDASA